MINFYASFMLDKFKKQKLEYKNRHAHDITMTIRRRERYFNIKNILKE